MSSPISAPVPPRLKYPDDSAVALNAAVGVASLRRQLIPLGALEARICQYDTTGTRLERARVLSPSQTASFATVVNRLETYVPPAMQGAYRPTTIPPMFLFTFADGSRKVTLDDGTCRVLSNGVLSADPTATWLNELKRYTSPGAPASPLPTGPAPGTTG